jgi:hypothetical protein
VHMFGQAVSAPWHGDDIAMVLRGLAERLAQHEDVAAQVGLLHESVRPDCLHQVVFGDDLFAVADQNQKYLKGLRRERDGHALFQQRFSRRIDPKRAEFVELFDPLVLPGCH